MKSAAIDWETAEAPEDEPQGGNDADDEEQAENQDGVAPGEYRMHGLAFMCTYNNANFTESNWDDFERFAREFNVLNHVKDSSRSMERSTRSHDEGRIHFHMFFVMKSQVDWKNGKAKVRWVVEVHGETVDINPNIRTNYLAALDDTIFKTQAPRGSTMQASLDAGHFYLMMDKVGKIESRSNLVAFQDYYPDKSRLDKFRLQGKLTDDAWLRYHSFLTIGFSKAYEDIRAKRKYAEDEKIHKMRKEQADIEALLRSSGKLKPFRTYEPVQRWLAHFGDHRVRYPVLLLLGPSHRGKTEYAKSLFAKPLVLTVGSSNMIPNGLRNYERYGDEAHTVPYVLIMSANLPRCNERLI